jgi:cytochrome c oxidase cbb3-type subunit II
MTRTAHLAAAILLVAAACTCCSRPADVPPDLDSRLSSDEARRNGRDLFLKSCALCHGERGDGQGARASAFATPPRDFTSAAWRRSVTPEHVFRSIRDGIPGTAMPAWRALGDDSLANLTAYVLTLRTARDPS